MDMPILLWHLILFMVLRDTVKLLFFLSDRRALQKKFPRRNYTDK